MCVCVVCGTLRQPVAVEGRLTWSMPASWEPGGSFSPVCSCVILVDTSGRAGADLKVLAETRRTPATARLGAMRISGRLPCRTYSPCHRLLVGSGSHDNIVSQQLVPSPPHMLDTALRVCVNTAPRRLVTAAPFACARRQMVRTCVFLPSVEVEGSGAAMIVVLVDSSPVSRTAVQYVYFTSRQLVSQLVSLGHMLTAVLPLLTAPTLG